MKKDKIINIVRDSDLGLEDKLLVNPIVRYASRGIVFNEAGEIAVFNKRNKNFIKLIKWL